MPPPTPPSLRRYRALAAVAIVISGLSLAVALALPTATFRTLVSPLEVYSILSGISTLWEDGNWILATIVFLFSVILPIAKLVALSFIWLGKGLPPVRRRILHWLELSGKWSMVDVFVIGLFVSAVRLGPLANSSSRAGIYVYAGSIGLSMLATRLMAWFESGHWVSPLRPAPRFNDAASRLLSSLAFAALIAALSLSIFEVKKAFLFRNEVLLLKTTWSLGREGETVLAICTGLWVIGTTSLRSLLLLRLRWLGGAGPRTVRSVMVLDEWAMLDVYGLAAMVVYVKLDELTDARVLAGFWMVAVAAILTELDAWRLRRAAVPARGEGAHSLDGTRDSESARAPSELPDSLASP